MKMSSSFYRLKHLRNLSVRRQQTGETIDEYFQQLNTLSKKCNFKVVAVNHYSKGYICVYNYL